MLVKGKFPTNIFQPSLVQRTEKVHTPGQVSRGRRLGSFRGRGGGPNGPTGAGDVRQFSGPGPPSPRRPPGPSGLGRVSTSPMAPLGPVVEGPEDTPVHCPRSLQRGFDAPLGPRSPLDLCQIRLTLRVSGPFLELRVYHFVVSTLHHSRDVPEGPLSPGPYPDLPPGQAGNYDPVGPTLPLSS